jgi:hypothetical protein
VSIKSLTTWKKSTIAVFVLVCLTGQTGCSRAEPTFYATGSDYLQLKKGQTFLPSRDMTLATESVIQRKDEQILDLLRVNETLVRELDFERSR